MTQSPSQDQVMVAQLSSQVMQSDRRFRLLRSDADEVASMVLGARQKAREVYDGVAVQAQVLQDRFDELATQVEELKVQLRKISGRFRYLVKDQTLQSLDKRVDGLPYEKFISRREFDALLWQALSRP